MYIVNKGAEKVMLPDQIGATDLIQSMIVMGCGESIKNQYIGGNKEQLQLYEVCFLDKHIKVYTQEDALRVISWMFTLGCNKASVERLVEDDNTSEKTTA